MGWPYIRKRIAPHDKCQVFVIVSLRMDLNGICEKDVTLQGHCVIAFLIQYLCLAFRNSLAGNASTEEESRLTWIP